MRLTPAGSVKGCSSVYTQKVPWAITDVTDNDWDELCLVTLATVEKDRRNIAMAAGSPAGGVAGRVDAMDVDQDSVESTL